MAFYPEEDDVWKCPRHPSKRRRTGVCPVCLKQRLSALCPDCANLRPCSCCSTSSSSSSSSSFSLHFADGGSVGKISSLIACEPPFRRSRSAAASSFVRFSGGERKTPAPEISQNRSKSSSIWSVFWPQKAKRDKMEDVEKIKLRKSRSVAVGGGERLLPSAVKWKSWYFPSPMKVFRQSKAAKIVVHERSPLHRG